MVTVKLYVDLPLGRGSVPLIPVQTEGELYFLSEFTTLQCILCRFNNIESCSKS